MKIRLLLCILLMGCHPHFKARITKVIDGDSFYISTGGEVRLSGCDAPENTRGHFQQYGPAAKQFAVQHLQGRVVFFEQTGIDQYGRRVCKISTDGNDFGTLLVQAGLAWVYRGYGESKLYSAQLTARRKKTGLWAGMHPVPPFVFRQQNK